MLHPDHLAEVARLRHQDDLKRAEVERLCQEIKAARPGLLYRASNLLRIVRQRLDTQAPPPPVQPAVRSISDQFKQVR